MSNSAWKNHERRVARRLNGTRNGATGMATTDVTTTHFEIECKHRKKLPDWLQGAVKQAENGDSSKIPLVVLHQANMHSARDLCVLRMCDFDQLRQAFEDIEFLKTCAPDVYQRFFEEAE